MCEGAEVVGRTRLYQSLGSPLIHGNTRPHRRMWPYVVLVIVVLAVVGTLAYMYFVR